MPEDFYAALMMRRALPTTTNIKTITAPGIYPVDAGNANAPGSAAGALVVLPPTTKPKLKFIKESDTSIYTLIGSDWKKPTATDVDAVAKAGDTMTGRLIMNVDGEGIRLQPKTAGYASYIVSYDSANKNHWYVGAGSTTNANVTFLNYKGANNSISLNTDGTVNLNPTQGKSAIVNGPLQIGAIGSAVLNIGDTDSGLRNSVDGAVDLWANNQKRGYWNATTFSFTGQIIPTNYSNFDTRYQRDTRLGARNYQLMTRGKMFEIAGNVITGLQIEGQVDGDGDYIVMRPLQKQVNGTWYTVAQA